MSTVVKYGGRTQCPRCGRTLRIWVATADPNVRRIQGTHRAAVGCLCGLAKHTDSDNLCEAVERLLKLLHPPKRRHR